MIQLARPCPICRGDGRRPFLPVDGYRIVQCERCDFLFVDPAPTERELADFYQQESYYRGSALGYNDYFAQRPSHERLARARLRRIEQLVPRGSVLDVGCAAGFFLHVARQRGWTPRGVELSADMAAYAAELAGCPIAPRVAALEAPPASFDAITLWEYIEHIPDPRDEIERLVGLLRPGGALALSTPNTHYWTAVHRPERWREFKPPAHIGFFTAETLRRLLEASGLQVVTIRRTFARAPSQPYPFQRMLGLLRERVGNGADRRTPLWWSFSLAWRTVERLSQLGYALRWPDSDVHLTLEAYARKP